MSNDSSAPAGTASAVKAAEKATADNAEATANAPTSAAAEAGKATGKHIPDAPEKAEKPRAKAQLKEGANAEFKEPGSTLNPSDPAAPNYRFETAARADALSSDQSIDQGTGVQPASPMLSAVPAGGGAQKTDDGLVWSDEVTARGRVISATKGAEGSPTTTYEEELAPGATDAHAAAAKERLHRRFLAA